jgi:hypothetical protein
MKSTQEIIILFLKALLFSCSKTQQKGAITIRNGTIGMIGFDSLVSKKKHENNLRKNL